HPARRVAYQQEQRLLRRLLEGLEQRVGGVRIEFIDGVDDATSPALRRRGRAKERNRFARLIDRDDGAHDALIVCGTLEHEKAAMRTGDDATGRRIRWVDLKA